VTLLLLTLAALATAAIVSEWALAGTKLQTGLARVLLVFGTIGGAVLILLAARGDRTSLLPFAVFWSGAFLTWFGVRSHIESSILLRMVFLLRSRPLDGNELLRRYESLYGIELRIEELLRSGLAERAGDRLRVTAKGRRILAAAAWLR